MANKKTTMFYYHLNYIFKYTKILSVTFLRALYLSLPIYDDVISNVPFEMRMPRARVDVSDRFHSA